MSLSDTWVLAWSAIIAAIVGAISGGIFGHWLTVRHQRSRAGAVQQSHLAALEAEIDYCGKLAGTYATEGIAAPLYRFPKTVYETVYPTLVSETLSDADVSALTSFYSQVDQMNRGLDAIGRYWAENDAASYESERHRLRAKAEEMRHPDQTLNRPPAGYEFFKHARAAVTRHRK